MDPALFTLGYLASAIFFLLGLKALGHPRTAPRGNRLGALGMLLAVLTTLTQMGLTTGLQGWVVIGAGLALGSLIGWILAVRVQMTGMPSLVALFNGLGGSASALVALSEAIGRVSTEEVPTDPFERSVLWIAIGLSAWVGAMTLTGSLLAMAKLKGGISLFGKWIKTPTWGPSWLNLVKGALAIASFALIVLATLDPATMAYTWGVVGTSALLGILLVLPIGGADMPVVVSLLNAFSGLAAAFTGFINLNVVLIVAGSLVGASGLILTVIMCKAMNRSLSDVLFKRFVNEEATGVKRTKVGSDPEEVAMLLDGAEHVVIIPGYGMAVAQAQHAVKEFADLIARRYDTRVSYGIHPVAGRMPGHMNVLLAEANVPYEQMVELEDINGELPEVDVALIIGANDTVNPAARGDSGPLAGMPILDADKARTVVVVKRSLSPGYAGVDNDLFYLSKTLMLFGDGKVMMTALNKAIEDS